MDILETIVRLLAAAAAILAAWALPRLRAWLIARTDRETAEQVLTLTEVFAQAAEQLLKAEDPTGEKRMQYVSERLEELGVEVTEAVIAMVESAVWSLNTASKKE